MSRTIRVDDGASGEIDIYSDDGFRILSDLWTRAGWQHRTYRDLSWMGVPIWQLPQDLMMMHELIWKVRPDVIVETGLAHGGSAVFYASTLELMGHGHVISVEWEIPQPVQTALLAHPMSPRMTQIQGNSIDDDIVARVREMIEPGAKVLVALDSKHTRAHVRRELEQYAPLVGPGSYIVVFDGNMVSLADAPDGKPEWVTDNPATAAQEFLAEHPEFEPDPHFNRLGATYCPEGFLRRKDGGPSDVARDAARRQADVVRTSAAKVVAQVGAAQAKFDRSLEEERRRHTRSEDELRKEIAELRSKLEEAFASPTWRAGRFVARLGKPFGGSRGGRR
jgi:cephalosporin hydroxylase